MARDPSLKVSGLFFNPPLINESLNYLFPHGGTVVNPYFNTTLCARPKGLTVSLH